MSSNIRINRICQFCAKEFEARTTVTRYCSEICNKKHYKYKVKQAKISVSDRQTAEVRSAPLVEIKSKDYLTVRDAAKLLNSSRQTIHNLIKSGKIIAVNLKIKKTMIRRSDIDKLFEAEPVEPVKIEIKTKPLKEENCYSIGEAEMITGMSGKALYDLIKRNDIPKIQKGKFVYVPKSAIEPYMRRIT